MCLPMPDSRDGREIGGAGLTRWDLNILIQILIKRLPGLMGNGGILMVQKQLINNGIKQVTYCFFNRNAVPVIRKFTL